MDDAQQVRTSICPKLVLRAHNAMVAQRGPTPPKLVLVLVRNVWDAAQPVPTPLKWVLLLVHSVWDGVQQVPTPPKLV